MVKRVLYVVLVLSTLLIGYWYLYLAAPCRGDDGNPAPCWVCGTCPVRLPGHQVERDGSGDLRP